MKMISVVIPCYNEENSVELMHDKLTNIFREQLPNYSYEIIFVDDFSTDSTREIIERVCLSDSNAKAVFNAANFGFHRNVFECFRYASGDAVFMIFGDMQEPPEMLPQFVEKWEQGYKCVVGQSNNHGEKLPMRICRRLYYWVMNTLSQARFIPMMNGFGLYDRCFVDAIMDIDETSPFFKAVVAEYGSRVAIVPYEHAVSLRKKSNFNFAKNYDFAMHGLTHASKVLMRVATFLSLLVAIPTVIFGLFVFIKKLLFWDSYPIGLAAITVGVFFLGSVQLFFLSIVGEYVLSANERAAKKPRVIVERYINMDTEGNIRT